MENRLQDQLDHLNRLLQKQASYWGKKPRRREPKTLQVISDLELLLFEIIGLDKNDPIYIQKMNDINDKLPKAFGYRKGRDKKNKKDSFLLWLKIWNSFIHRNAQDQPEEEEEEKKDEGEL